MQGAGLDGLELLDLVKGIDPDLPVVMISGHGNIETAVSAIKRGAYDFLEDPLKQLLTPCRPMSHDALVRVPDAGGRETPRAR